MLNEAPHNALLPESTPNPALAKMIAGSEPNGRDKTKLRIPMEKRYHITTKDIEWPPEVQSYNRDFTKLIEDIKKRHDPTVTTVAQGVLEWKKQLKTDRIGLDIQSWLDRFLYEPYRHPFLDWAAYVSSLWFIRHLMWLQPFYFLRHCTEHTE